MIIKNRLVLAIELIIAAGLAASPAFADNRGPEPLPGEKPLPAVAPQPIIKISDTVRMLAEKNSSVSLVVELNSPEHRQLLRQMRREEAEAVGKLTDEIRSLVRDYAPQGDFASKDEERRSLDAAQGNQPFFLQDRIDKLNAERETAALQIKEKYRTELKRVLESQHEEFRRRVESLGGKVTDVITVNNSVAVELPSEALDKLSASPDVIRIDENAPGEPELDNQLISLGVSSFWNDGDDGGVWDVGVLDGGVEETHSALSSHTILENYAPDHYHGTGVACMYASTHATYRGLAYGLDKILVDNAGASATSMAGADWMVTSAADNPEVINYSWGNGTASTTSWGSMARFVDGIVDTYNVVWAKSAGNSGYDADPTITQPGENYNGITVANMDDRNTTSRSDDYIRYTSSRGPTYDGRKKPDMTAPGHNTYTCDLNNTYDNLGGTSSAAPKVGAVSLLLKDSGHYYPISMKATLINTADSWDDNDTETTSDDGQVSGKEWNRTYGWGYLDAWHAEFHKDDYFIDTIGQTGASNDYKLYVGQGWVGDKATAVWEREVDYNDASTPTSYENLSDINIRLYDEVDHTLEDYDFSGRDNVHQVAVETSGRKVIKVYAWNSSKSESVALATEEGFTRAVPPSFSQVKSSTPFPFLSGYYTVSTNVTNNGSIKAHNMSATINLPPGVSLVSSSATVGLDSLAAGASDQASWLVYAPVPINLSAITYTASSSSYGETFSNTQ